MRRTKRAKHPSRRSGAPTEVTPLPVILDDETRQMLDLIARLIARGNFDRELVADYFKDRLNRAPVAIRSTKNQLTDFTFLPSQVITLWTSLPEYLLNGRPRPLYAKRTRLSFAALVYRLDPQANPDDVLHYLIDTRCVKQAGQQYVLISRIIRHRRAPAQQQIHHRRVTLALVRTLESNARQADLRAQKSREGSIDDSLIYQFAAVGFVPESQMEGFRTETEQLNDGHLLLIDGIMARRSRKRKRGERLVPVSEVIFTSEDSPLARLRAASRIASRRRPRRT